MNAALNVYIEKFPINSWSDVEKSDFAVLTWPGSILEDIFKLSPDQTMQKIYQNKIKNVPHENQINGIGYKNTVSKLIDSYHIAIDYPESYKSFQEYPCQITYIKSLK